jgi:hypothetical protein
MEAGDEKPGRYEIFCPEIHQGGQVSGPVQHTLDSPSNSIRTQMNMDLQDEPKKIIEKCSDVIISVNLCKSASYENKL